VPAQCRAQGLGCLCSIPLLSQGGAEVEKETGRDVDRE